jgi:hypothetical protein
MKQPLDPFPYPQDARSRPIDATFPDGLYVYVQDDSGIVWGLPDGPHMHPKVLGNGKHAMYAGDLTVEAGKIKDVTNLSGTFGFDDELGLLAVADQLGRQGIEVEPGAIRFFPADGSRPQILG